MKNYGVGGRSRDSWKRLATRERKAKVLRGDESEDVQVSTNTSGAEPTLSNLGTTRKTTQIDDKPEVSLWDSALRAPCRVLHSDREITAVPVDPFEQLSAGLIWKMGALRR